MSRYHGIVGYAVTEEELPGIWVDRITEKPYYGDLLKHVSKWNVSSTGINDNKEMSAQISIIADPYAMNNFTSIKYVSYMGSLWKVTSVEIQRPRIILTVGGIYNGEQTGSAD